MIHCASATDALLLLVLQEKSNRLRHELKQEGEAAEAKLQQMHDMHAALSEHILAKLC